MRYKTTCFYSILACDNVSESRYQKQFTRNSSDFYPAVFATEESMTKSKILPNPVNFAVNFQQKGLILVVTCILLNFMVVLKIST